MFVFSLFIDCPVSPCIGIKGGRAGDNGESWTKKVNGRSRNLRAFRGNRDTRHLRVNKRIRAGSDGKAASPGETAQGGWK
jgi:hypothetical protein